MAFGYTLLTGDRSTALSTRYVTDTASPSSQTGHVVLAAIHARNQTTAPIPSPTISGWGLSWSSVRTTVLQQGGNAFRGLFLMRGVGTAVPGGASTITFPTSTNLQAVQWAFIDVGGVSTAAGTVFPQATAFASTVGSTAVVTGFSSASSVNASIAVIGSNSTVAMTPVNGTVVYQNSTFLIVTQYMSFLNTIAYPAKTSMGAHANGSTMQMRMIIVGEMAVTAVDHQIAATLRTPATVTATIPNLVNHHIAASLSAKTAVTATLEIAGFKALAASLTAPATLTATLSKSAVTKALAASLNTSATVTATLSVPGSVGRSATSRNYDLDADLVVIRDDPFPITETFSFGSTASPHFFYNLNVTTDATFVSLVDMSNCLYTLLIPDATNTVPLRLAYEGGDDGFAISSQGASLLSVGAPTTGFLVRTTVEGSETGLRVGLL